jgi:inhibitor of cysteine peptidase
MVIGLSAIALVGVAMGIAHAQESAVPKTPASATSTQKAQTPIPQTVSLEAPDDGKQITLTKGTLLVVRLETNPSTGCAWGVIGDPAPLVLVSAEYGSAQGDQQKKVGAPDMQVLRFKANHAGRTELTLGYRRPWKKGVAPAKTFHITVTVPEAPLQ